MCERGDQVTVNAPGWWHRPKISVDRCIAPAVEALWAAGFVTLGCCCSHGERSPSFVMNADPFDADRAQDVARASRACDGQVFRFLQWRLMDVTCGGKIVEAT